MTTFVDATLADVNDIVALVNLSYRGELAGKGWTTESELLDGVRTTVKEITSIVSSPTDGIILARADDGSLSGCVRVMQTECNSQPCLYLGMLSVHPLLQSRGLGKALLNKVKERCIQAGFTGVSMSVFTCRTRLIEFYERHGFVRTDSPLVPFPRDQPEFGIPKVDNLEFAEYFWKPTEVQPAVC